MARHFEQNQYLLGNERVECLTVFGVVLCILGFFLMIPGMVLTCTWQATGFHGKNTFNIPQRNIGIVLLVVGFCLFLGGLMLTYITCMRRKHKEQYRRAQGAAQREERIESAEPAQFTLAKARSAPYEYPRSGSSQQRQVPPTIQEEYGFDPGHEESYEQQPGGTYSAYEKEPSSQRRQGYVPPPRQPRAREHAPEERQPAEQKPRQDPYRYPQLQYPEGSYEQPQQEGYHVPPRQSEYSDERYPQAGHYPGQEGHSYESQVSQSSQPERVYRAPVHAHQKRARPTSAGRQDSSPSTHGSEQPGQVTTPSYTTGHTTGQHQVQLEARQGQEEPDGEEMREATDAAVRRKKKKKRRRRLPEAGGGEDGQTNLGYDTAPAGDGAGMTAQPGTSGAVQGGYMPPQSSRYFSSPRAHEGRYSHGESNA